MGGFLSRLMGKASPRPVTGRVDALGMRAGGAAAPALPMETAGFHVNDGPHYLDVLAEVHRILRPEWYLEVGTRDGQSLALALGNYVAIDPEFQNVKPPLPSGCRMHFLAETSDDAFASGFLEREGIRPDFGFLDGMHLAEFLMRDFINYEASCRPGARVALHDCLPGNFLMENRDREKTPRGTPWAGDVWKVLWWILQHRPDLKVNVLDAYRTGLVIIEGLDPENTVLKGLYDRFTAEMVPVTLQEFGREKFFAAFEIQSSYRFVQELRERVANNRG